MSIMTENICIYTIKIDLLSARHNITAYPTCTCRLIWWRNKKRRHKWRLFSI